MGLFGVIVGAMALILISIPFMMVNTIEQLRYDLTACEALAAEVNK
jgi:ABC-type phosphate transport system permease subunit